MKVREANTEVVWLRRFANRFKMLTKDLHGVMSNPDWTGYLNTHGKDKLEKQLWKALDILDETEGLLSGRIGELEGADVEVSNG